MVVGRRVGWGMGGGGWLWWVGGVGEVGDVDSEVGRKREVLWQRVGEAGTQREEAKRSVIVRKVVGQVHLARGGGELL